MNYLAHAYLSFGDTDILSGNMFSDFVKGKKKFSFPEKIQKGISLHRSIDQFTDDHRATASAKKFFKPVYGLYSAAFMDIVYDHFLATDKKIFAEGELIAFSERTYKQLKEAEPFFPERFGTVFQYMQLHNWLYNYRFKEGIFRGFQGLVHRAVYIDDAKPACDIFIKYYDELQEYYEEFFPELKEFARMKFEELVK